MKLKKVAASATVIISFVSYSAYQRVFGVSADGFPTSNSLATPFPSTSPIPARPVDSGSSTGISPAGLLLGESPKPSPSPSSTPKSSPSASASPKPTVTPSSTPKASTAPSPSPSPSPTPTTKPSPSPTPTPSPSPSPSPSPIPSPSPTSMYKDGQFTGVAADAFYGFIQVQATISNGRITNVVFLQAPSDRSRSISINQHADPILAQEAIAAQSAQVNIVSGATASSQAFIISMQSALDQAKN